MIKQNRGTFAVTALAMVVALGMAMVPTTAVAAGSIKAAYVETVIPSKSYSGSINLSNNSRLSFGPNTGVLGISSLTLTNYSATAQQVFIFEPIFGAAATDCYAPIIGAGGPQMTLIVQGNSTLHLTYPSPLVYSPLGGHTCIGAEVTTLLGGGSIEIVVNGFLN
jgi:hypothetical protein